MKEKILIYLIVCFMPAILLAKPDSVTINGLSSGAVLTQGDRIEWNIYLSTSSGEMVTNEIWVDLNDNGIAEQGIDILLVSFSQTDGDGGEEGIPDMDEEINGIIYSTFKIGLAPASYIFKVLSGTDTVQATFRFNELSEPTYTISGNVVYFDGSPAPNIYIAAENEINDPDVVFHWGTLTGENGNYTIKTRASYNSEWYVGVKGYGSYLGVPEDTVITLTENVLNVNFRLVPSKIITGVVKNESDQPLANVLVKAHRHGYGKDRETVTNANGVYYLSVSEGGYFVIFYRSDYIRTTYNQKYVEWLGDTVTVLASDDTVKNINATLRKGGVITGTIRNGTCDGVNLFTDINHFQPTAYVYPDLPDQRYSIMVLPGSYYIMFSSQQGAIQVWYNQKIERSQASIVTVNGYPDTIRNIDVDFSITSVVEKGIAPKEFRLMQNYPNPFNPSTILEFSIPSNGRVKLTVTNILGQDVAVLFNGIGQAGVNYKVQFDGSNLTSGIYFARLEFGGRYLTKKIVLVK